MQSRSAYCNARQKNWWKRQYKEKPTFRILGRLFAARGGVQFIHEELGEGVKTGLKKTGNQDGPANLRDEY